MNFKSTMFRRFSPSKHCLCLLGVSVIIVVYILYFVLTASNSAPADAPTISHIIEHYENDVLRTPKIYPSKHLHDWVPALTVQENPGKPGELGKPVHLHEGMKVTSQQRFTEHEFDIIVSEMISANQSLPDVRDPECLQIEYASQLPTPSNVIIFHNEAWSTLIRSVWSIINRSPKGLIRDIILVDDKSTLDFLGDQLDEYVKMLPVAVKIIRMEERLRLIKARLRGTEVAQEEVITFLDAHIECAVGWLEPLPSAITENRRVVAVPTIDTIDDKTLEFKVANRNKWGGFDWKLGFNWFGCVGHIFRDKTPYTIPGGAAHVVGYS